jgi:hypothetical protein
MVVDAECGKKIGLGNWIFHSTFTVVDLEMAQ